MLAEQNRLLEELYREYFPKLLLYADSALQDKDRAQDVVQDTFHEAIRHIDTLAVHKNPGGWLMETVKNKIKDSERARCRYIRRFLSLNTDIVENTVPSGDLALDEQVGQDSANLLQSIEDILTPEEIRLLKRLAFDKAGHLQAAKELGITVYASQKRFQRVKEKLYKLFPDRKKKK